MYLGYGLNNPGFESLKEQEIFFFSKISKTFLWLGTWWLFSGGKEAGPEADDSPASSAEVQNYWSFTSTPTLKLCHFISQLTEAENYEVSVGCNIIKWVQ
jgi:hypothetical protein